MKEENKKCSDCGAPINNVGGSGLCLKCFQERGFSNITEAIDKEQREGM